MHNEDCNSEINYAVSLRKRIIPIIIENIDISEGNKNIRELYMLNLSDNTESNFQQIFNKLLRVLKEESDYHEYYKRLLVRGLSWKRSGKQNQNLLSGFDLIHAREWYDKNKNRQKNPPHKLLAGFITKSDISRPTVYISHDRENSIHLVRKLNKLLIEYGFNVWADSLDHEEDFDVNTLNDAIVKSDNVLYVISHQTHSSKKTTTEIQQALEYRKSIIVINHISDKDRSLYRYVEGRPEINFRQGIDVFDSSFDKLIELVDRNKNFLRENTTYLQKTVEWDNNLRQDKYLLLDGKRKAMKVWLQQAGVVAQKRENIADVFADFYNHCQLNARLNQADVFLISSPANADISELIYYELIKTSLSVLRVDIAEGKTKQKDINEAIARSGNVIVLISESTVASNSCMEQVDYSVKLNKRIFPLLIDDVEKPCFHPNIREKNILDFRGIEPQTFASTQIEKSLRKLVDDLLREREYFEIHRRISARSFEWDNNKRLPSLLLSGKELEDSQNWIIDNATRTYMLPSRLQMDIVAVSKEKINSIQAEIFVSYHNSNSDFARILAYKLRLHGKITQLTLNYDTENRSGREDTFNFINTSDNFLIIVSKDSLTSEKCKTEYLQAKKNKKRIISLIYSETPDKKFIENIDSQFFLDFNPEKQDFNTSFNTLIRTLETDKTHIQEHNKWQKKALEWEKNGKPYEQLIRGSEYEQAKIWLQTTKSENKKPAPTPLQIEFIEKSRQSVIAFLRRERNINLYKKLALVGIVLLMIVSVIFGFIAYAEKTKAQEKEQLIQKQFLRAERLKNRAIDEKTKAEKAEKRASEEKRKAEIAEQKANKSADSIKKVWKRTMALMAAIKVARDSTVVAYAKANDEKKKAKIAEKNALKEKRKAEEAQKRAEEAKLETQKLFFLSEARILSNTSIKLLNVGEVDTAFSLSLYAYYMNKKYEGPEFNRDIFDALSKVYAEINPIDHENNIQANAHEGYRIKSISFNKNKTIFATGGVDKQIALWQKKPEAGIQKIWNNKLSSDVMKVMFSDDGNLLCVGTYNGEIVTYNLSNNNYKNISATNVGTLNSPVREISVLKFNGNYLLLASSYVNSMLFRIDKEGEATLLWNTTDTESICKLTKINNKIYLATGDEFHNPKIKEITFEKDDVYLTAVNKINLNRKLTAMTFSKDGKYLALGTQTGYILVYETGNYTIIKELTGHHSAITCLQFMDNTQLIASSSYDHTTRIWDYKNPYNEALVLKHSSWVLGHAYNPDNKTIFTINNNGEIKNWYASIENLVKALCESSPKSLSHKEFGKYTRADFESSPSDCLKLK